MPDKWDETHREKFRENYDQIFHARNEVIGKFKNAEGFEIYGNTLLALTQHALRCLDLDDEIMNKNPHNYFETAVNWLVGLPYSLQDWNEARTVGFNLAEEYMGCEEKLSPKNRNNIDQCVRDCIKRCLDLEIKFLINPEDYFRLPGLSAEMIKFNQFVLGLELAKEQLKVKKQTEEKVVWPTKAEMTKPKTKYQEKLIDPAPIRKKFVAGIKKQEVGILPRKIALHFKVEKGGDIEKIKKILQSKTIKATQIESTELSKTKFFNTYQITCQVAVGKENFWKSADTWPIGIKVRRWKGNWERGNKDAFIKRVQISRIGNGINLNRVINTVKKIYSDVDFVSITGTPITNGVTVLSLKVNFNCDNGKSALLAAGPRHNKYPTGVKVKWLKIEKKNYGDSKDAVAWEN